MKQVLVMLLLVVSPSICSAGGVWTSANSISKIDEYGGGMRVYGVDISINPASCSSAVVALPGASDSDAKLNRFNSVILSAFMAGKRVMLKLSDTACTANNPTYYAVRVLQ